jgi:SAM-dependent methyltransferase
MDADPKGGHDPHKLRATFEQDSDLYDRARPNYPAQIFDDLGRLAEIPVHGRILEIGPGTGQATLPLAKRGYEIVGIELGQGLSTVLRCKLAGYPEVEIINAPFETWEPDEKRFDSIVAFTAFHWIDRDVRFVKAAQLLKPDGTIAIVATQHVLPEMGDLFWVEVHDDYGAVDPEGDSGPPPAPDQVPDLADDIQASELYENVATRRYLWDVTYTASEYISVLNTYSGHIALAPTIRNELCDRIRRRIENQPFRKITKTYLATLNVARKR